MNPFVAGGVALALAAVGSTALSMSQALLRTEATTVRELPGGVAGLQVDLDTGDLRVVASDRTGVSLERRETWSIARPDVTEEVRGDVLHVHADCTGALSWCDVSYELLVPTGTRVLARTGSGSMTLVGTGAVEADTGSGDVSLAQVTGSADLRTGSGEVQVADLRGDRLVARTGSGDISVGGAAVPRVTARTGSGEVRLGLTVPSDDVRVETGSGDVDVQLPDDGGAWAVRVDTGSGDRDVRVRTDPDAPRPVVVRTGSGDVSVRYGPGDA